MKVFEKSDIFVTGMDATHFLGLKGHHILARWGG